MLPLIFLLVASGIMLQGQVPTCESDPDAMRTAEGIYGRFEKLPPAERYRASKAAYEELIAAHPRDLGVFARYGQFVRFARQGDWPVVRAAWVARAKAHPDDGVALTLGAMAQLGKDTPDALRMLESAAEKDPKLGMPRVQLASLFSQGRFEDTARAGREVAAYFAACPDSADREALSMLGRMGSKEVQAEVARRLRARLAVETDPWVLRSYAELWGLEFRLRPPAEHAQVRAGVLKDADRLAGLAVKADGDFVATIRQGYKLAGGPAERMAAVEERLLREFPDNFSSLRVRAELLRKAHPQPKAEASAEEWDRYSKEWYEAVSNWVKFAPHEEYSWNTYFAAVSNWRNAPKEAAVPAAEGYVRAMEERRWPREEARVRVAGFYLDRGVETERAIELLESARPLVVRTNEILEYDYLSAKDRERYAEYGVSQVQEVDQLLLRAYRRAGLREKAAALRTEVDGPEPAQKDLKPDYWENRGLLAWVEGRKADALAYFQAALFARDAAPGMRRGRVEDPLMEQARALWAELQGTDAAFAVWAKAPAKKEAAPQGEWEKPEKELPPFELSDMEGKVWKLKALEGKTVFINLWATWCGPCLQEMPKLQKFYEENKGRSDLVILTLNADEQVGLVAPFLKEKGYTFPVVPAWSYMNQVLGEWAIPQNWVVDAAGKWRWQQLGYDDQEKDWAGSMLAKIASVR